MFEVGASKKDITAFLPGIGMMGYGMHFNTVKDVETPLFARAYFFRHIESGECLAMAVCDMCFITISVKRGILKKLERKHPHLKIKEENLFLMAQHTHSGPGGYSHYGLYNITIPGFVPQVYQDLVEGITAAIVEAYERKRPARLYMDAGEFAPDVDVAFNRSMKAYLNNPECRDADPTKPNLAVNREMSLLRIDGYDGERIGAINWFGVHTTSVHNDNHSICWDNKGYAAEYLENDIRALPKSESFVGAFAQGSAGDVTPNYVWDRKHKWTRGRYEDDFKSAQYNGKLQYEMARRLYDSSLINHEITGGLDYGLVNVNFANVHCNPEYTGGVADARTGPACHGVAFFAGTTEGPGMAKLIKYAAIGLSRFVKFYERSTNLFRKKEKRLKIKQKYRVQGKKDIMIESGERRVLGTSDVKNLIVPAFADTSIRYLKALHPQGWDEDKPWTPHILPLQIVILGDVAFAAIPAEPTTIAARRIQKVVEEVLLSKGIHKVLIAPYANAYCGYITTREEYAHQSYEGGHTVFGQWTLAAFQTKFRQLAEEMSKKARFRDLGTNEEPPEFSPEELGRRSYGSLQSQ